MKAKVITGIVLALLFIGVLTLAFNIQQVKASGTIYIRADGLIEGTDKIINENNITYRFKNNITDSIVVERDHIVIDGAGYTLQGTGGGSPGINLTMRSNVTITNMKIDGFWSGIYLPYSSNNTISGNNITNIEVYGITLGTSDYNNITGNNISSMGNCSILLASSDNNSITKNNMTNTAQAVIISGSNNNDFSRNLIANTAQGITLQLASTGNRFFHNTFLCSFNNVHIVTSGYANVWDDGYPSGGNYWNDYNGTDLNYTQHQNETGSDGIGDTPYFIDDNNQDNFPLMNPWNPIETFIEVQGVPHSVIIESNTTIDEVGQTGSWLHFRSSGPTGETGYVRLVIPAIFNASNIRVFIDGIQVFPIVTYNENQTLIYFEFQLSTHNILVQFGPTVGGISLPVDKLGLLAPYIGLTILLAAAVVAVVYVKKRKRNRD